MDKEEKMIIGFGVIMVTAMLAIMYIGIQRDRELSKMAKAEGCEYLGRPRDVHRVMLWNCGGQVVQKLIPQRGSSK